MSVLLKKEGHPYFLRALRDREDCAGAIFTIAQRAQEMGEAVFSRLFPLDCVAPLPEEPSDRRMRTFGASRSASGILI